MPIFVNKGNDKQNRMKYLFLKKNLYFEAWIEFYAVYLSLITYLHVLPDEALMEWD